MVADVLRVAPDIRLVHVEERHLEIMRFWKNSHRNFFFSQDLITAEGQRKWFQEFKNRSDDFMFVVDTMIGPIGTMGYRLHEGQVDIYNVMRGIPNAYPGVMHTALACMIGDIEKRYPQTPISVRVLNDNPAVAWYQRFGFVELSRKEAYVLLILSNSG